MLDNGTGGDALAGDRIFTAAIPTSSLAAIYRKDQVGLSIEEITVDDPLEREVLIRSVATGVCHSDLHVIDGHINAGKGPLVLGHEGAARARAACPRIAPGVPRRCGRPRGRGRP